MELQIRNLYNQKWENLLKTAKYLYSNGLLPEGKEKNGELVIKTLEDLVTKEF